MTGSVIYIYKLRLLIQRFLDKKLTSTIRFLYLSKGLESGCQVMGFVIHLKNTRNLVLIFSEIWLTIVKWLGIGITDMDTVDAPSVCHIYLYQGITTFFGCTTSTECDQYFEFLNHQTAP